MTRLYKEDLQTSDSNWKVTDENFHILRNVLRSQIGDLLTVVDGKGGIAQGKILEITKKWISILIHDFRKVEKHSLNMTLLVGLPKGEKSSWIVEKGVEWGVHRIIFLESDFTNAKSSKNQKERWKRVAIEALRQSGNPYLPLIEGPISLDESLKSLSMKTRILFDEKENQTLLRNVLPKSTDEICLAIGSEGGWSDEERRKFREDGFVSVQLAPYILRTETAVVSAISAAHTLLTISK